MKAWERLRAFAQAHGADVVPMAWDPDWGFEPSGMETSPFADGLGVHWPKRLVYIDQNKLHDPRTVGGAVHELGHVLACREPPRESEELSFLGWEFLVARLTQCYRFWLMSMRNYGTTCGDWGDCSLAERKEMIGEAIADGITYGNIVRGHPVSVRLACEFREMDLPIHEWMRCVPFDEWMRHVP